MKLMRALVLLGGLSLMAIGLVGGMLGAAAVWLAPADQSAATVTVALSFVAIGFALGSATAWQAWQSIRGRPSPMFGPRRAWPLVGLLVIALLLGQRVLALGSRGAALFAPLHIVATALPALIVLAVVGRRLCGVTRWREIVLQIGSGAVLSTTLAMLLELLLIIGLVIIAIAVVASLPGGLDKLQSFAARLEDPISLSDPSLPRQVAGSPLAWAGLLLLAAAAVPLIEETVKTVGVGLMSYRRPGLAQTYLWGLASGAGFAITESLLNSLLDLDAWLLAVVSRIGATLMHCITGGLMGIAWFAFLRRRWRTGLGLYIVCLLIHGSWNALAVTSSLLAMADSREGSLGAAVESPGPAVAGITAALVLMALAACVGLAALTRYVRDRSQATPTSRTGSPEAVAPEAGGPGSELPPGMERQ